MKTASEMSKFYWYVVYYCSSCVGSSVFETDTPFFLINTIRDHISKYQCKGEKVMIVNWINITKEQVDDEGLRE